MKNSRPRRLLAVASWSTALANAPRRTAITWLRLILLHASRSCCLPACLVLACSARSADVPAAVANDLATNQPPAIEVRGYNLPGNTVLPRQAIDKIFADCTGPAVHFEAISKAVKELILAYRGRGFATVAVRLPPQQLTNGIVYVEVTEGLLAEIIVADNRHFSSNNVMRSLPSLRTNIILNSQIFKSELDRANANQDRQIYPEIQPGPELGTTTLLLKVKDRLPLHGKVELNNQSTPATPELRVNTSVFYNNLWDREHSIGFQYGFTPESFKDGTRLPERFYDSPLIANYSAYYRLPLKSASSVTEEIANSGGSFGYNEVTRQFRLPPTSGRPEFNFYVARSTSDTDVKFGPKIVTAPSTISTVYSQDSGRDLTLTENLGFRYTQPVPEIARLRSTISAGFDFKFYRLRSFNTNNFLTVSVIPSDDPSKPPEVIQGVASQAQPTRVSSVAYVPFAVRWDADRPDASGTTSLGLAYTANFVLGPNAGAKEFERVAGSSKSTGKFLTVNGTLSREQRIYEDWSALVRLDGQWANEPLVSNEQFGIGGTAGVRGYREGERYGDLGWRVTFEPHTPMLDVGMVDGTEPMRARASVFLDYGESYLSDPQGRASHVSLLGTGFGVMATIGHTFDLRLTFAWPLLNTAGVRAGNGRIYFGVGAQF